MTKYESVIQQVFDPGSFQSAVNEFGEQGFWLAAAVSVQVPEDKMSPEEQIAAAGRTFAVVLVFQREIKDN